MSAVEPGRCGEHWDDCRGWRQGTALTLPVRLRRLLPPEARSGAVGYDLYRIARRLSLPPRIVAAAFCKSYLAPESCLPALRLTPDPKTGNCRFFEGSACTIHAARPAGLCALPLGQSIDTVTAQTEYYVQTPLCGARAGRHGRCRTICRIPPCWTARGWMPAGPSSARSFPTGYRPRAARITPASPPLSGVWSVPSTTTTSSATTSTRSFVKT